MNGIREHVLLIYAVHLHCQSPETSNQLLQAHTVTAIGIKELEQVLSKLLRNRSVIIIIIAACC